jgi:hypothetical protein
MARAGLGKATQLRKVSAKRHGREACTALELDRGRELQRHRDEMLRWLHSEYASAERIADMVRRGAMSDRCDRDR